MPSLYDDPVHFDLLAQMTAPRDVPFYLARLPTYGGPVLELGCGTGRITLPMAAQGVETWGIDNVPAMLERARTKADAERLDVRLVEADCRTYDLGRRFPLILFPYNAINHLLTIDDLGAFLAATRRHMTADSRLIIDTFNPDLEFLSRNPELKVVEYLDPDSGARIVMREQNAYDAATQINRVAWRYDIDGREDGRVDEILTRVIFPQELAALLQFNGFEIEEKLGSYDGEAFSSSASKQLTVCRLSRPHPA